MRKGRNVLLLMWVFAFVQAYVSTDTLRADDTLNPGDVLLTADEIDFFTLHWTDMFADIDVDVSDPNWVDKSRQAKMDAVTKWLLEGVGVSGDDNTVDVVPIVITVVCTSPEAPYGSKDVISGTIVAHGSDSSSQSMMTWIRVSPSSSAVISVRGVLHRADAEGDLHILDVRRTFHLVSGEWNEAECEIERGY